MADPRLTSRRPHSLTQLPKSMDLLASLTSLTLSSNPLSNIVECCRILSGIKSLRALSVTIDDEEAVAVPLLLPQLTILNGNNVGVPGRRQSRVSTNQQKGEAAGKDEENALAFAEIDLEKVRKWQERKTNEIYLTPFARRRSRICTPP